MITLANWGGLPKARRKQVLDGALRACPGLYLDNFPSTIRNNLHVLDAVIEKVVEVRARGFNSYSMRTIIEVLRHHSDVEQVGSEYRINNVTAPDLARLLMAMFPDELDRFFQVRNGAARQGVAA